MQINHRRRYKRKWITRVFYLIKCSQFLEKDVLNELLNILRTTKDHLVTNCILESVSMLVYFYLFINICRINIKKCITYVLKSMNDFIIHPYNFEQEDTQDYYINFMKVLS